MRTRDENKVSAILDHALDMIVNEGFDGLSMQKLAKAAGVSPATIYIYFKDRDDLILQLYKIESDKFYAATIKGMYPEMSFAEGLKQQWKNRFKYALENPRTAHFMEHVNYTPLHDRAIKMRDPVFLKTMETFVKTAIKKGELVKMPFEVYWPIAYGPLYHLIRMHKAGKSLAGDPFKLTDQLFNAALKLVLKALTP